MAQRSLIAACTSGLANRLLMLAGAQRIARLAERKLFLYWPENDQLGCPFDALFKDAVPMIRDSDMHELLRSDRSMKVYNARHCAPLYDQLSPDGDPPAEIVLIKGWTAPKFANETLADIRDELCDYLRRLTPQDALLAAVNGIALPDQCLGMHVRHGESWKYLDASVQSKREHFETILRAVMAERADASFVLATTQPPVEEYFRSLFGERMIMFPKSSRDRGAPAVREALIDLLLLSRTRGVLGTYGSTFSQVAAMLGPKLLVVAHPATATAHLPAVTRRLASALNGAPEPHLEL
jgi:hypothetical protein